VSGLDRSHDPSRRSWIASAAGHADFPIQNLPFAMASVGDGMPECVVAIGSDAVRLERALQAGWGHDLPLNPEFGYGMLFELMDESAREWTAVRLALSDALSDATWQDQLSDSIVPQRELTFQLPTMPGDFTDFYASIHHATNVGSMFRPDNPLLPNYKWVPIGYHGRTSSIVTDGTAVRRPEGQTRGPDDETPTFGPTRSLDYELELGICIGASNDLGSPVRAQDAAGRIFGLSLLNDWSARDVQAWEYQPLGPFLAKNFATTLSNWVVTTDALRPFRVPMPPRPAGDPEPLPHLRIADDFTYAIELDVMLSSSAMRARGDPAFRVSRVRFDDAMYWSMAQLVTHHGSNGCNLGAGDLLGTGTISGPTPESRGCLLERTWRGTEPLSLPDGTVRRFLEDGDEVTFSGRCTADGAVSIGFGRCSGVVAPA